MSEFESKRKVSEKAEKRNDVRKEKLAGYFYMLSQLTFAGFVLVGLAPVITEGVEKFNPYTFIAGVLVTVGFAFMGNRILKY